MLRTDAFSLAPADLASSESVGVGLALFFIVVLRLLLPTKKRRILRQPIVFLILHGALRAVEHVMADGSISRRQVAFAALLFVLASIGRGSVLLIFEVLLRRNPLPRIVQQICQGVVYLSVLLAALRIAGVEPGSILTTSALLTAVLAFSLQETLGNLVAGLAIQVERPFDVDDWIQFDAEAKHVGRVLEINWRATKVITLDLVEVTVPNSTLAKAPIVNFTKPTPASRRSLFVMAPADVSPHRVQQIILEALVGSMGVLQDPPASVVTNAFVDGNVEYWVRFYTEGFDKRDAIDGAARDRIWYSFARAAIPMAFPNRAIMLRESHSASEEDEKRVDERAASLQKVDFLKGLPPENRRALASASRIHLYAPGETIVRQGDDTTDMFIVKIGEVVVMRGSGPMTDTPGVDPSKRGQETELARLGPGEFFGEMALVAGERRTATVRALTPCKLIAINHRALRPVLEAAPELAEHVSKVIAARQAILAEKEAEAEAAVPSVQERTSLLLGRIRKFFVL